LIYGQESGTSSQPLVTSGAMERLGSSFLEPSLTTRDALDKFQVVAQKVVTNLQIIVILVSVYPTVEG